MNKHLKITLVAGIILLVSISFLLFRKESILPDSNMIKNLSDPLLLSNFKDSNPLTITAMRNRTYPGSGLNVEEKLANGANYDRYLVSYLSDGLKINALLTVPTGIKPIQGWPAIIFNHGYIPPNIYQTTERYVNYVDALARSGFIIMKPDYRGNGNSEGQPEGAYYSPAYAIDVLNALSSIKMYKDVDPQRIGMWGHSMGGNITLRDIVVNTSDVKAAVIWGGVVGSYDDLMNNWQRRVSYQPPPTEMALRNNYRKRLTDTYGTPQTNPSFWNSIDPTYFLADIKTPIQLHTGGNDEEVPVNFSVSLKDKLVKEGKYVEYYNYPGGDHNISSPNFETAMQRTIDFFNKYLK